MAALLLLLSFTACVAENNQVGMLLLPDDRAEILYVRCPDRPEVVTEVEVRERNGATLWQIVVDGPVSEARAQPEVFRVAVGETPPGFDTRVPLREPLTQEGDYTLSINAFQQEGFPHVSFTLEALDEENVFGPIEAPVEEFIDRAAEECIPSRPPTPLSVVMTFLIGGLVLVGLATTGRRLGERSAARIERERQSRSDGHEGR